jgi:phosphatidylinositol alpha-1,6-mannosyltransferase
MSVRLAVLSQDFPPAIGGIQTYTQALAAALVPHVENLVVIAPDEPGAAAFDRTAPHRVVRVAGPRDWMRVTALPTLMRTFAEHRTDVVLTTTWGLAATARAASRTRPVFAAAHGQELLKSLVPRPLSPLYAWHRRATLKSLAGVFAVSRFTAGLVGSEGVARERIHVVPNGVDVERWRSLAGASDPSALARTHGIPDDAPVALTIARLIRRKGVDTVLQALPAVAATYPNLHYLIIGDGPERDGLEHLTTQLGLRTRVHFLGAVDDLAIAQAYRRATFFIMPARDERPSVEGFGLVFREAHAFGKPVIGAATGGIPDAIRHGVDGLLVPPDAPEEAAAAMIHLLSEPELACALGEAGRTNVLANGTWAHVAHKVARVLESSERRCASH